MDAFYLKRLVRHGAARLGIHVCSRARQCAIDLREERDHPLVFGLRYPGRDLLLALPAASGIGLFHYPPVRRSPLSGALDDTAAGHGREALREALTTYYEQWQPANAAAFFGLDPEQHAALAERPCWSLAWPWDPLSVEAKRAQRRRTEGRETRRLAGRALDVERDGWKFCGPVSPRKLEVEVERLWRLAVSIREHGVRRHSGDDGDIRAIVLVDADGRWGWQVLSGQHRFAVLRGLGHERIAVRVTRFVHRDQAIYWPRVVDSTFSVEAALEVFDGGFPPADEAGARPKGSRTARRTDPCLSSRW
ncbi:hypothetical protein [Halomonas getboli]|uniref:hypothetical protein n=1 Tax=Halomonas getboli TaxID=2935862 RepID=UPI001FFFF5D1|nr:hypothetical protein [Halomonas getboli]MCK2183067.1 hypothetical protein [Halomonas getboli]